MAARHSSYKEEDVNNRRNRAAELRRKYKLKNADIATRMGMTISWVSRVLGPNKDADKEILEMAGTKETAG